MIKADLQAGGIGAQRGLQQIPTVRVNGLPYRLECSIGSFGLKGYDQTVSEHCSCVEVFLVIAHWRKLWVASLALAALSGFFYGWEQRTENPPFVITTKAEEPPETKLLRKGRYDEAAKAILESIKDEKKEYFKYESVAAVYVARAVKDPTNREKWVAQAALYIEKSVALAPADPINFLGAASGTKRLGDISGQGCPYYEQARQYAQTGLSQLKTDCIFVSYERVPTKPIRSEFSKLLGALDTKTEAKCGQKP